jgi:hypothetical protein
LKRRDKTMDDNAPVEKNGEYEIVERTFLEVHGADVIYTVYRDGVMITVTKENKDKGGKGEVILQGHKVQMKFLGKALTDI